MSTTDDDHNRFTRYIYTYTGAKVEEEGGRGVPTVTDIAVHCGRVPRFAGATLIWWPVLLHLFVVREIVIEAGGGLREQLEALFHDAHEAVTGDIPSPFKPPKISSLQRDLDRRMRAHYGIPVPSIGTATIVKEADTTALLAEAHHLMGAGDAKWVRDAGGADPTAVRIVQDVLDRYPAYGDTLEVTGEAVQDYIMLFESMLEAVRDG